MTFDRRLLSSSFAAQLQKSKLALSLCIHNVGTHLAPCLLLTVWSCLWSHCQHEFQEEEESFEQRRDRGGSQSQED